MVPLGESAWRGMQHIGTITTHARQLVGRHFHQSGRKIGVGKAMSNEGPAWEPKPKLA